jgi:serine/threonine protein kinase
MAFFSDDFKNLITSLLLFDPSQRASMTDVKAHPWFNNPDVATLAEIQGEFIERKKIID